LSKSRYYSTLTASTKGVPDFVGAPYEFWVGGNVGIGTSVGQIRITDVPDRRAIVYDLLHSYHEGGEYQFCKSLVQIRCFSTVRCGGTLRYHHSCRQSRELQSPELRLRGGRYQRKGDVFGDERYHSYRRPQRPDDHPDEVNN
jgi:hypothetical protein